MTEPTKKNDYKALGKLGLACQVFVGATIVVDLVQIALTIYSYVMVESGALPDVSSLVPFAGVTKVLHFIAYLVASVLLIPVIRRAFRNLAALNVSGMSNKEWYCIWGFIIPIASWFIPWSVVNEIWKASDPAEKSDSFDWKQNRNSRLILGWWISYIFFLFFNFARQLMFVTRGKPESLAFLMSPGMQILCQLVFCAAGVLLILVVRDITVRQEKKYALVKGNQGLS